MIISLSLSRILAETLWASSLVIFLASSLSFYFLIDKHSVVGSATRSFLVILRVVLLDGLFLIMGIILGVCIIKVSVSEAGGCSSISCKIFPFGLLLVMQPLCALHRKY